MKLLNKGYQWVAIKFDNGKVGYGYQGNHRIGMMYRTFERMDKEKQKAIREDSKRFLSNIEWERDLTYL